MKLEEVKEQTIQKINYISDYFSKYINVIGSSDMFKQINFIDCMSNAGMYMNDIKGTATRIFELMIQYSSKFHTKVFNLFVNDIDNDKIEFFKNLISGYTGVKSNISVYYFNEDVNDFFDIIGQKSLNRHFWKSGTVLFVDPWNFGSVNISSLVNLLNERRVELIFNYMHFDYSKNRNNQSAIDKMNQIEESVAGIGVDSHLTTPDELLIAMKNEFLKTRFINFVFNYPFKTKTKATIYQIMYCTPHIRGLEKLKESLWCVFSGEVSHTNTVNAHQQCLFGAEETMDQLKDYYYIEIKPILLAKFKGKRFGFNDIAEVILEQSMFKQGQIINCVLKRLIKDGNLLKLSNSNAYKTCEYEMR